MNNNIIENKELGVKIFLDEPVKEYRKIDLDKQILEKWVNALESGNFQQGDGHLCVNDYYCCLGVLAEIEGRLKVSTKVGDFSTKSFNGHQDFLVDHELISKNGALPFFVSFYSDGCFSSVKYDSLSQLNDNGATFSQIAWVIRVLFLENNY